MILMLQNRRVNAKKKMSKSLVGLFLLVALCFGIDLGFVKIINKKYRLFIKCISYVMKLLYILSLLCMYIRRFDCNFVNVTTNSQILFEFLTFLFSWTITAQVVIYSVVLVVDRYSTFDFMLDLQLVDEGLSVHLSELAGIASVAYVLGLFLTKIMFTIQNCQDLTGADCDSIFGVIFYFFFHSPILSIDAVALELFLVYYNLYCFIKLMKESYKTSPRNLKTLHNRYVSAANCFDRIRPHYDKMLLIELILDVFKLLGLLWGTLVYIKLQVPWEIYAADYFSASHVIFQITLPAWMAYKVNSELDAIKLLLHDQLVRNNEDNPEILRFLRYLEARPLNRMLWGVVPVDLRLPLALFSIFTTYFIVIIQFTHVYD